MRDDIENGAVDAGPAGKTGSRDARRAQLLDSLADHLLAHGLAGSPLRKLATAASTSDRMLLYYFADRDDLLTSLLAHVASRLEAMLDAADTRDRRPWTQLLQQLWASARTPLFRPYMLLFLELAAAAAREEEPHRTAAGRIADGFASWVADRLDVPADQRKAQAILLLATLDGLFLLDSAGRGAAADAALALRTQQ
jgi:AcrR family transcriptional regulator